MDWPIARSTLAAGPAGGAVICGHLAWGAIRAEPELLGGKGLVVAGLITGYLGIVVGALSQLGVVVMTISIYLDFR